MTTLDLDEVARLAEEHYVSVIHDPLSDLCLANYSEKATYDHAWAPHPLLLACRGIVYRPDGTIIARPFPKFFGLSEHHGPFPTTEPEITHKVDGSMITSWAYEGALQTATRGSFTSDQARFAHHWLSERGAVTHFLPHLTYVFEAIYPADRIVVDYGERAECVLLGLVETATGHNMAHIFTVLEAARLGVPAVPRVQSHPWRALANTDRDNFEGYVAFWPESQLRLKLKLPTYIQLHRLLAGLSEHAVWEALAAGTEALLRQACPEEAWDWFDRIALELCRAFEHLVGRVGVFAAYACTGGLRPSDRADRKVVAERLVAAAPPELRGPCFAYLDGKPVQPLLWKLLEPDGPGSRPSLGRRLEEAS